MSAVRKRRRPAKPDLSDESDAGGIDDLDLAQRREEPDELDAETPAQKRLRLARSYLEQVKADVRRPAEVADGVFEFSAEDVDRELIADRLVQDQLEAAGKAFHRVADTLVRAKPDTFELDVGEKDTRFFGGRTGHRLAVTGLAFATQKAATGRPPVFLYSVSKDSNIIKWDFYTGKEIQEIHGELKRTKKRKKQDRGRKKERDPTAEPPQGHVDEIWSIAVSSDGKYLATGSKSAHIKIHSIAPAGEKDKLLHTFNQHRDSVSGLAFRRGTSELYSASFDRTVKVWNADAGAYVETLFGHQDPIPTLSAHLRQRCLTPGSRDRTLRLWKIPEESQLVYRLSHSGDYGEQLEGAGFVDTGIGKRARREERKMQGGSMECGEMIDEEWFLSGSDVGSISLWNATKKKPVYTRLAAHQMPGTAEGQPDPNPCWVSALASLRHTDLFASGSSDGFIRLWKIDKDMRGFRRVAVIPVKGVVNALAFFEGPDWDAPEEAAKPTPANRRDRARGIGLGGPTEAYVYLAAAVGDEHRLGRWFSVPARNRVVVVKLGKKKD